MNELLEDMLLVEFNASEKEHNGEKCLYIDDVYELFPTTPRSEVDYWIEALTWEGKIRMRYPGIILPRE